MWLPHPEKNDTALLTTPINCCRITSQTVKSDNFNQTADFSKTSKHSHNIHHPKTVKNVTN